MGVPEFRGLAWLIVGNGSLGESLGEDGKKSIHRGVRANGADFESGVFPGCDSEPPPFAPLAGSRSNLHRIMPAEFDTASRAGSDCTVAYSPFLFRQSRYRASRVVIGNA